MKIFNEERAKELEKIARPAVKNDPISMFASDEDLLIYEHFFINGMEESEDIISKITSELQQERELRNELVETLGNMYFAEFGGNARSLEEAMERAPKSGEYEQRIISLYRKSKAK